MSKLTRDLRDRCVEALRANVDNDFDPPDQDIAYLADQLHEVDVDEEHLTIVEAIKAAESCGWAHRSITGVYGGWREFWKEGSRFLLSAEMGIVTATRYAPPDLLDGRLAALDDGGAS